eukprot:6492581-Amphidinium_carterae.3
MMPSQILGTCGPLRQFSWHLYLAVLCLCRRQFRWAVHLANTSTGNAGIDKSQPAKQRHPDMGQGEPLQQKRHNCDLIHVVEKLVHVDGCLADWRKSTKTCNNALATPRTPHAQETAAATLQTVGA